MALGARKKLVGKSSTRISWWGVRLRGVHSSTFHPTLLGSIARAQLERMMKYMLQFWDDENRPGPDPDSDEGQAEMAAWYAYSEALISAGVWVSGEALQPPVTATVVRVRDGSPVITDGPFAETKESFGGFEIIDVADLDEAISWAERSPVHPHGLVEVRPVMEMPDDPDHDGG